MPSLKRLFFVLLTVLFVGAATTPTFAAVSKTHKLVVPIARRLAKKTAKSSAKLTQPKQAPIQAKNPSELARATDTYTVTAVVDGDTIKADIAGKNETIRFIGIDTPEVVDPRKPVQCFGSEASAKTKALVEGKRVKLATDPSQGDRDKYGRLLRYVFLEDTTFVNKVLISDGFAHEYTYDIPYQYQTEFRTAEREAREASRGLWATNICPDETAAPAAISNAVPIIAPSLSPQPAAVSSKPTTVSSSTTCLIKGNISSDNHEKIYHVPGGFYYDKTVVDLGAGERWFCSEDESIAAGWRKSKR